VSFALDWLVLRERVDHRSRAAAVTLAVRDWALARWSRTGRPLAIIDLAGGAGSNFRFLAEALRVPQRWTVVDHDASLLAAAEERIATWRQAGVLPPTVLDVRCRPLNLAEADLATLAHSADLIATSAFLDLVSQDWCDRLVAAMARRGAAFLATLTYDGRMRWTIEDTRDPVINRLINRHQELDKGFGPALGPRAFAAFRDALENSRATVTAAESDWVLDAEDRAVQSVLISWWADAAKQAAPAQIPTIDAWLERRRHRLAAGDGLLIVGHRDLLATW
jgi:hypothetical protein